MYPHLEDEDTGQRDKSSSSDRAGCDWHLVSLIVNPALVALIALLAWHPNPRR